MAKKAAYFMPLQGKHRILLRNDLADLDIIESHTHRHAMNPGREREVNFSVLTAANTATMAVFHAMFLNPFDSHHLGMTVRPANTDPAARLKLLITRQKTWRAPTSSLQLPVFHDDSPFPNLRSDFV
jgi:hypothetical protein